MDDGLDSGVLEQMRQQNSQFMHTLAQFQLDFEEELQRLECVLDGGVVDTNGVKTIVNDPLMNKKGINHSMKKFRSWMSKMVAQSYFTDKQINAWGRLYVKELTSDSYAYGEDWNLKPEDYTSYVNDCIFSFHAVVNCARNGRLGELVGKITKTVESNIIQAPQQKGTAKI